MNDQDTSFKKFRQLINFNLLIKYFRLDFHMSFTEKKIVKRIFFIKINKINIIHIDM